jgi:threonine-phosphate decarboxylase
MSERYVHGGDMQRAARQSGISPDRLLDFSANINPMGLPKRAAERLAREAQDPSAWSRYPDPETGELRAAISKYIHVSPDCIVIGAGADSLIHTAVRALAPQRCVIPIPAFSEYARACRACGCESIAIPLAKVPSPRAGDLLFINNPHNPTGVCASRSETLQRIAEARGSGAAVLVDEAFIDYVPGASITADAALQNGVVAIRSLTKFFGCPGLRVGYAVAAPETARSLAANLPPWPVTTLASNVLAEALADEEYRAEALERNQRARTGLSAALSALGCVVNPAAANFLLLRLPAAVDAAEIRAWLLQQHAILVRECDTFAGLEPGRYLRVAVRHENENARLVAALSAIFKTTSCLQTHA